MSSILLWLLTISLFTLGVLGIFIPFLPGVAFIFFGVLLYAWATNFSIISLGTVVVFGIVVFLAWLAEYLGSLLGAKLGGGGRYAMWGSILGGFAGLVFIGPLGLLIGVVVGVILGALYEGKTLNQAGKTAFFSILGILGGKIIQLVLTLGIIVTFIIIIIT